MKNCCCEKSVCTCVVEEQPETSNTSFLSNEECECEENSQSCSCTESIDYIPPGISISAPINKIKYRCEFKDNKEPKRIFSTEARAAFSVPLNPIVIPFGPAKLPTIPFISLEIFQSTDVCFFDRSEIEKKFDKTWNTATKRICSALMSDVLKFTNKRQFTVFKSVTTMEMFYTTFSYFVNDIFRDAKGTTKFFKKLILIHSVQYPPKCLDIFTPVNGVAIYEFFCNTFFPNLILLKAVTSPVYIIKLNLSEENCDNIVVTK